jgi:predicted Zn-dependent protease
MKKLFFTILLTLLLNVSIGKTRPEFTIKCENLELTVFKKTAVLIIESDTLEMKCFGMKRNQFYLTNKEKSFIVKLTYSDGQKAVVLIDEKTGEEKKYFVTHSENIH